MSDPELVLDGRSLEPTQVASWVHEPTDIALADGIVERLGRSAALADRLAEEAPVYGRTTGVGANLDGGVDPDHGVHLLRSHAAGAGPAMGVDVGRAMMLVRVNQLANPGSGIRVDVVEAIVEALNRGLAPRVHRHGAVGTGDLGALAELGLCLLGERPWSDGSRVRLVDRIDAASALPLMSSSSATLAVASIAQSDLRSLVEASVAVAGLSAQAVRANPQAWSAAAGGIRDDDRARQVASTLRQITAVDDPPRLQDPLSFRCIVPVAGAVHESLDGLESALATDINAGIENPRFDESGVWHHGGFATLGIALSLDQARLALAQSLAQSMGRLSKLVDPAYTGLPRFLSHEPGGHSGVMALEYVAAPALRELRSAADPVTRDTASLSLGVEDGAYFTWSAALATGESVRPARVVLACELVAAVRALRMRGDEPESDLLAELLRLCEPLPPPGPDRPLTEDIAIAEEIISTMPPLVVR